MENTLFDIFTFNDAHDDLYRYIKLLSNIYIYIQNNFTVLRRNNREDFNKRMEKKIIGFHNFIGTGYT